MIFLQNWNYVLFIERVTAVCYCDWIFHYFFIMTKVPWEIGHSRVYSKEGLWFIDYCSLSPWKIVFLFLGGSWYCATGGGCGLSSFINWDATIPPMIPIPAPIRPARSPVFAALPYFLDIYLIIESDFSILLRT